jgi:hypothetical protein
MYSRELPIRIQDKIATFPEYKYGVNKITVVLSDQKKIQDVYVAWGKEIIKVGSSDKINFDPAAVVDVVSEV